MSSGVTVALILGHKGHMTTKWLPVTPNFQLPITTHKPISNGQNLVPPFMILWWWMNDRYLKNQTMFDVELSVESLQSNRIQTHRAHLSQQAVPWYCQHALTHIWNASGNQCELSVFYTNQSFTGSKMKESPIIYTIENKGFYREVFI